ncbi:putative disease resistance protein [Cardamine amara subsp. amara]|uniref:Disease resistance protein n=1 Tax=Cardamine amara subsp. amara TaxID=228776 RepID=A0ABD1BLZ5_CARAN
MADSLLSFGFEKLWDLLVRESERFQGVQEQFDGLTSKLRMLRCFLEDADAKQHTSAMVRNAVKDIKEIVYDAEDIIETFLLKEELSKTRSIKKHIRKFAWVFADRRGLAFDMEDLSKRITDVIDVMKILSVQKVIKDKRDIEYLQERQRVTRETFSSDNEDHLVGLEKNVELLVGYLVKEDSTQVVSITGMGGIGKTTLVRQVFNHVTVKSHFAGLVWVCVSQQFTRKYAWQTILWKLRPEYKDSKMPEQELREKIFQVLETQNTLIVIDDIWREEDWDIIKPMFPRNKGWKVLLTSRNEGVGLRADPTCFTFKQDCLTPEESWTLFQRIAFPRENSTSEHNGDKEMEEMGKHMIKLCGGLPLAVKVLGGLLTAQHTISEWKRLYENIRSHIVRGTSFNERNHNSVYHILYMSFEELPIYLKQCFLYLAHFPEDCAVNVENLSYYWAAEGIPRPRGYDEATIRKVAERYIEELVKRNMVISQRDATTSRFETCQLHDMMREVCLHRAEEENFLDIVDTVNYQSPWKSRRIAVHRRGESYHLKGMMKNPKLRSLLFIKGTTAVLMPWDLLFTRLQFLRELDLSSARFEGGKVPSSIGKLIHLRYLSLFMAEVTQLPSSMRNLKLLLYLNLYVAVGFPIYIPNNVFNEMRKLMYLYLPGQMHDTVKMELSNLVNLETLENFSTKHSSVRDLHGMTRLETLTIIFNGGCTMKTLSSSLSELGHLENLTIYGSKNGEEGFVLDCVHLKQLRLSVFMPRLPDQQHFPSHLTTISLFDCRLEEDPMPILEKLLHLNEVNLFNKSFSGRKMVCLGGGFSQLQKLELVGLKKWEEWVVEEGSMPLLHTLTIRNCGKLKELPDGLRFITSLKELNIDTFHLKFKEKLSRGGKKYYKVQHIPLVQIELVEESDSD